MNKMTVKLGFVAVCLVFASAYGCGSDDRNSRDQDSGNGVGQDVGNGSGQGDSSSQGGDNITAAPGSSAFEYEVVGGSYPATVASSQADKDVGDNTWGARILESSISIFLKDSGTTTLSIDVKTSENDKMPAVFSVGGSTGDSRITFLNPSVGDSYVSDSEGTIKFENCPRAQGEHIKGSFHNIKLKSVMHEGRTQTLNGSFDILVYFKSGDLFCEGADGGDGTEPATCQADMCKDSGVCCPYRDCAQNCQMKCIWNGCEDPESDACRQCVDGCFDECDVSQECRSALAALDVCAESHKCNEANTNDENDQCLRSECCSELIAAY